MVLGWATLLSVWVIAQIQESLCQEQSEPGAIQGPIDKQEKNTIQNNFQSILHTHFLLPSQSIVFSSNKWFKPQLDGTKILLESYHHDYEESI